MAAFGRIAGAAETFEKADLANRHVSELKSFDRYGMRIDQVAFHPAYHDLMGMAIENEVPSFAWRHPGPGSQVAHAALSYMFNQAEGGVMCPMAMTYSAIPPLRRTPGVAGEWIPRLLATSYDPRDVPAAEKSGATMGMFMTEKQGGSDVRTNTTRAVAAGESAGEGAEYRLTGHKFFCSAPMLSGTSSPTRRSWKLGRGVSRNEWRSPSRARCWCGMPPRRRRTPFAHRASDPNGPAPTVRSPPGSISAPSSTGRCPSGNPAANCAGGRTCPVSGAEPALRHSRSGRSTDTRRAAGRARTPGAIV